MKKRFSKIYVEITNMCNLKCEFCLETNREKKLMKIEEFAEVINKIKTYTDLILLHVKGEPLLHENLKEILDICYENNIKVNITTNTTLLNKNIDVLSNSLALRQLNLSMHDLEQNKLDEEKRILDVINVVKKIKEKNKGLIVSYRLWNMSEIGENGRNLIFLKLIEKEYGIKEILNKCKNNNFLELDNDVFLNQDIEFEWPSMKNQIVSCKGKCYGLKNQIAILVNGDVVPCCLDTDGDIVLGNIFKNTLEQILEGNRAKRIIEGFNNSQLVEELCKRCNFIKKFN